MCYEHTCIITTTTTTTTMTCSRIEWIEYEKSHNII